MQMSVHAMECVRLIVRSSLQITQHPYLQRVMRTAPLTTKQYTSSCISLHCMVIQFTLSRPYSCILPSHSTALSLAQQTQSAFIALATTRCTRAKQTAANGQWDASQMKVRSAIPGNNTATTSATMPGQQQNAQRSACSIANLLTSQPRFPVAQESYTRCAIGRFCDSTTTHCLRCCKSPLPPLMRVNAPTATLRSCRTPQPATRRCGREAIIRLVKAGEAARLTSSSHPCAHVRR